MKRQLLLVLLAMVFTLVGCTPSEEKIAAAVAMTVEAMATDTPEPTNTPLPTRTPRPTNTPRPTLTPALSPTLWPTPERAVIREMYVMRDAVEGTITIRHDPTYQQLVLADGIVPFIGADDESTGFYLHYSYVGDDWLFIDRIVFNVDGEVYRVTPDGTNRDVFSGGKIYEGGSILLNSSRYQALIDGLLNGQRILVRFDGSDGNHDYLMGAAEKEAIRKLYQVHRNLLDGTLDVEDLE